MAIIGEGRYLVQPCDERGRDGDEYGRQPLTLLQVDVGLGRGDETWSRYQEKIVFVNFNSPPPSPLVSRKERV